MSTAKVRGEDVLENVGCAREGVRERGRGRREGEGEGKTEMEIDGEGKQFRKRTCSKIDWVAVVRNRPR